jgi:membrane protease YdiL (CAAX protease family)
MVRKKEDRMAVLKDFFPLPGQEGAPTRKEQALEVLVFLGLVVPALIISFFITGRQREGSFSYLVLATILRDLALVALVLFFLWRNGEPRSRIGWQKPPFFQEVTVGVLLFLPFLYGAGVLARLLTRAGLSAPAMPMPGFLTPHGKWQFLLASLLVLVVAIAEETIFRGYLLLRLTSVTGSPTLAVLVSAALFSLGHGYEGSARMVTVAAMGVVLALIYLWRRNIVAPMVIHFLQDFIVLVASPLFHRIH